MLPASLKPTPDATPIPGPRTPLIEPVSSIVVMPDNSTDARPVVSVTSIAVTPPPLGVSEPQCAPPVGVQPQRQVVSIAGCPSIVHERNVSGPAQDSPSVGLFAVSASGVSIVTDASAGRSDRPKICRQPDTPATVMISTATPRTLRSYL